MNRLSQHDIVTVSLPQGVGGSFEAVVLAFAERGMTLQALDKSSLLRVPPMVPDVFVTFVHKKSLVGLPGTLFCVEPIGDLRFQVSEPSLHRTRGTRLKVEMPVRVRSLLSGRDADGVTVNIGPDGLLVECDLKVAVGDRVSVSFYTAQSDAPVVGNADVVRATEGMIAMHLPPESSAARNALGAIVVGRSRTELAQSKQKTFQGPDF